MHVQDGHDQMLEERYWMEENQMIWKERKKELSSICQSKAEEFHLLGYENVTAEEGWECAVSPYRQGPPALHQLVNDILSLKVTKFMNFLTMKVYRGEF